MGSAPVPGSEEKHLAELRRLDLLDSPPQDAFDRITGLAADLFKVPFSAITLVASDRVWIKSAFGFEAPAIGRGRTIYSLVVEEEDVLVIPNLAEDPRFAASPFVAESPRMRFFAGAPLRTRFGYGVGSLCIMDNRARRFSAADRERLRSLAALAVDEMELHAARKAAGPAEVAAPPIPSAEKELLQERKLFIGGPTIVFRWRNAEQWPVEYVSPNISQLGYAPDEFTSGRLVYAQIVHPDDLERVAAEVSLYSKSNVSCFEQEYRVRAKGGEYRWVYDFTTIVRNERGAITHFHGYVHDTTARHRAQEELREALGKYHAVIDAFDGQIYISSPDFKIEFANKRLVEHLGRNPVGEDCFRALHQRASVCPWCVNDTVSRGRSVRWEIQNPQDSRWYYVVNAPIVRPDGTISKMAMIQDITERKAAVEKVRRRETVLEATAFVSEQLLKDAPWEQSIQRGLERLGQATQVSRVYVFENHRDGQGRLLTSQRFEWCGQGTVPQIYNRELQNLDLVSAGYARWVEELGRGRAIQGHIREFPATERPLLMAQGIRSILVVPIFVNQEWWGFLGFDECSAERDWTMSEIEVLRAVAGFLGASIQRRRSEEALRRSEERNRVLLNAIPDLVFRLSKDGTFLDFKADRASDLVVPPEQIRGRNIKDLLPRDISDGTLQHIARALETGARQVYEYRLAIGGQLRDFEARIVPSGKTEVVALVREITEQKTYEATLKKLSSAVAGTADSVVITDRHGKIEYVNPAFERMTGYSSAEAIGRTPSLLKSGRHDREFYERLWRRLLAGESVQTEFVNRRKNGELYYQSESIAPIKDASGRITHFVSTGRDISERVAAEEALKQSQQRLSDIINFLPDATFAIDTEGRVLAWNRAIELMTGVRAADILGQGDYAYAVPFHKKRHPVLADLALKPDPEIEKAYRYVERAGDTLIAEIYLPEFRVGGAYLWILASPLFDARGRVVGAIESIRDITERHRTEETFRKLAAFPQHNPNAVLELQADGSLSYFNQAAKDLAISLGRESPQEVLPAEAMDIIGECLATGRARQRIEMTYGRRTVSWSFFPIEETRTVHVYGVDITERLALEAQMRHLQKMEAVGRLAGGVAHDFNNILTAILGYANLLASQEELTADARAQVAEIARAAEHASNLTRQLLAFSRKQAPHLKTLSLPDVLNGLTGMLRRLIGEDIALEVRHGTHLPLVQADEVMLEQIIVNLAINARDAMPRGGRITIATESVELDESYVRENPEARAGRFVRLSVSDTGVGIRREHRPHLFEPFFTTKEDGKGTGLGLATTYGIVKQHDGWIEVHTEEERGSTFSVFLPAHMVARPPETRPLPRAAVRGGTETVLVTEDEPSVRTLASSVLRQYGYDVLEAASGAEGLAVWKQNAQRIKLLLADIVMPGGVTGLDLAEQLKNQNPKLKVILTSGYHTDSLGRQLDFAPGVVFLPKPFSPQDLAAMVRQCLDEA